MKMSKYVKRCEILEVTADEVVVRVTLDTRELVGDFPRQVEAIGKILRDWADRIEIYAKTRRV